MRKQIADFLEFIKSQGVLGLAVAFVLGGAVSKLVTAMVTDLVNPMLSILVGKTEVLRDAKFSFSGVDILWGDFVSNVIDFLIIALIVYVAYKIFRIEYKKK